MLCLARHTYVELSSIAEMNICLLMFFFGSGIQAAFHTLGKDTSSPSVREMSH